MDWQIQSMSKDCKFCGLAFIRNQRVRTVLLRAQEGFERIDLCDKCWELHWKDELKRPAEFISSWSTIYRSASPRRQMNKDAIERILRELLTGSENINEGLCYILALILEQKKVFRLKGELIEGERIFLQYENIKSGELFIVPYPKLDWSKMPELELQIERLLKASP